MDNGKEAFGEPAKEFTKHLTEKIAKQPGWFPLLITCYLAVSYWQFAVPHLPRDVLVALCAYVSYGIGDLLDKITFRRNVRGKWRPRYKPAALVEARQAAREALGIKDGVYNVSMAILDAAHKGSHSVHFVNEFAKFIRSLLVPACVATLLAARRRLPLEYALLPVIAMCALAYRVALYEYPRLKTRHMVNLYREVDGIVAADAKQPPGKQKLLISPAGEANLFLWDGLQIAVARRVDRRPISSAAALR